jgi:sporulation protein YlmC with PRC-barrel domain
VKENEFDIGYRLLDDDLVDCDGRRCGKVDDVEIAGEPGAQAYLDAILVGSGAQAQRAPRPLRRLSRRILGERVVRIEWDEVQDIGAVVHLKRSAEELGLGRGDDRAEQLISWIPGA